MRPRRLTRHTAGCDMRIYVDYDDVLCETARALSGLAHRMFGRRVAYETIRVFNLQQAFDIDSAQHQALMDRAHEPDFLLALTPTPGAVDALSAWCAAGWQVVVVTGRPLASREASLRWLAGFGLHGVPLVFVDKYGREPPAAPGQPRALTPDELRRERFDLAIDDAPVALDLLAGHPTCHTIIFDRPWNRAYLPPHGTPVARCRDWLELDTRVRARAGVCVEAGDVAS